MKREHIVSIDSSLCNCCGLCGKDCPDNAFVMTDAGAEVATQDCLKCGHCVAVCPQNAVSISGFEDAPEEIIHDTKPDPDDFLAMMKGRRTIRQFTGQDVPQEIIEKIIEAGRYTPTGRNIQGVSYVVLREGLDECERLAVSLLRRAQFFIGIFVKSYKRIQIDDRYIFKGAPVAIVIKADNVVDGALAASAMELMARACGLGVLYSGMFAIAAKVSHKLKRKLSAGSKAKVVTTLVLGYPAVTYHRTAQRERPTVRYD